MAHLSPGDRPTALDAADELAAERAGTAYWREVARQRRVDAARVQKRPIVRAAIAVDRRTAAVQRRAAERADALRRRTEQVALRTAATARRARRRERRDALDRLRAELAAAPVDAAVELLAPGQVPTGTAPVVCVAVATAQPVAPSWAAALADAVLAGAGAATAQVVHPDRPTAGATPHDLLVRWEGIDVEVVDGAPRPVARRAGEPPRLAPAHPVALAGPTAVAVARTTWDRTAGLDPALEPGAALVDLALRATAGGEPLVAVPAALVADAAPVPTRRALVHPFDPDGPGWRALVERHGPALVRRGRPDAEAPAGPWSIAISTATPSAKMAPRSGDWHYAVDLGAALERAGHAVRLQTIDHADDLAGRSCDVHLVLRGLEPVRRTAGQVHVLWIISHPEALEDRECDEADLVLVASSRFAEHLRDRTDTPVEVCWQATDPTRFAPRPPEAAHRHPVTVVANTRGFVRTAVADAQAAGIDLAIYGTGWDGLVDPSWIAAEYASPDELPVVYSSATVVLNDHWETMRRWGFVSNRIFDVLATGTPIVSDHLNEIETLFGPTVPTWRDPAELAATLGRLRDDPDGARARAAEGRDRVLGAHTFDHRARELADLLAAHGLVGEGAR